jgi:hypothetical protein
MPDFQLKFDLKAFRELDQFALLARQKYNYGNASDWFNAFRGGLYGSYARIHGVVVRYHDVHSWMPKPRFPNDHAYQIASIFFNMASSLECITFAFNAFGFCVAKNSFIDVTNAKELGRVARYNIIGREGEEPLVGYTEVFPALQKLWKDNRGMLDTIFEQHAVSKHRETIPPTGKIRSDPPPGFFESMGIADDSSTRVIFSPMEKIIFMPEPKTPHSKRTPQPREDYGVLEDLVPQFREFIVETGVRALSDAKDNIALKVNQFEKTSENN